MRYMKVQGHIECLRKLSRKIITYNIGTGKVYAPGKFRLLHSTLSCLDAWLYIKNRGMQTGIFAAEEHTVCRVRSTYIEQLCRPFGHLHTVDQLTTKRHRQ